MQRDLILEVRSPLLLVTTGGLEVPVPIFKNELEGLGGVFVALGVVLPEEEVEGEMKEEEGDFAGVAAGGAPALGGVWRSQNHQKKQ